MSARTASVIIGVTGLVGSQLYELLKQDKGFETIRLIVRRPMVNDHAGTEIKARQF